MARRKSKKNPSRIYRPREDQIRSAGKKKSKAKSQGFSKKAELRQWDDLDSQEGYETVEEEIAVDEEIEELVEEFAQLAGPSTVTHVPIIHAPAPMAAQLTPDQLNALLQGLIHNVGVLTHNTNNLVTQIQNQANNRSKEYVAKPLQWDGKQGSTEARHFLAAFTNWAGGSEGAMNTWDAGNNRWNKDEPKWIRAILNLMVDDARTWALPYLEKIGTVNPPFAGSWVDFKTAFEKHFMPLSTTQTARDALKAIRQGSRSVAEYMSKFDQYTSQTGWSADDHRQRFYDGLSDRIKDALPLTAMAVATFDELRSAAQTLDQRMRQRDAEKKGGKGATYHTTTHDPDAMQVDATKQTKQKPTDSKKNSTTYRAWMKDKCYGCGSKAHTKKDGNHERDICNHCGKTGHCGPVCMAKYLGKLSTAKAAATQDLDSTKADSADGSQPAAKAAASSSEAKGKGKAQAKDSSQGDLLAQLIEQIKTQEAKIKALESSF